MSDTSTVFDIHVFTQYQENYGTFDAPHWKFRGGRTAVLEGFYPPMNPDLTDACAHAAVERVRRRIEYSNNWMSKERIIGWKLFPAGSLTEYEEAQMKFEGRIVSSDDRIDLKEGS